MRSISAVCLCPRVDRRVLSTCRRCLLDATRQLFKWSHMHFNKSAFIPPSVHLQMSPWFYRWGIFSFFFAHFLFPCAFVWLSRMLLFVCYWGLRENWNCHIIWSGVAICWWSSQSEKKWSSFNLFIPHPPSKETALCILFYMELHDSHPTIVLIVLRFDLFVNKCHRMHKPLICTLVFSDLQ